MWKDKEQLIMLIQYIHLTNALYYIIYQLHFAVKSIPQNLVA